MVEIIPGLSGVNFMPMIARSIYWLGVVLFACIILAVLFLFYRKTTFKMRATIWPLYGSGVGGDVYVGKPKYNRVKWNKNHTAWLTLKPFLNSKEREPFDSSFIYPGNEIYGYELEDEWIPCKHDIHIDNAEANLKIVPHSMRAWQSQVHKRNAEKYAKIDFWSENKYLFITLGCVITCAVLCLGTIWLAYKFAQPASANMASLSSAIQNMNVIKGVTPPG